METRFEFHLRPRVVFGDGALARLGDLARELNFTRTLVVADRGIVAAGHVEHASTLLQSAGIVTIPFHEFDANPDAAMVEAGRRAAADQRIDSILAVGGGSSLDCAKAINVVLTNGGTIRDYRGFGKALQPLLPSIGIPTTAGTGSEAQAYALISDVATHEKMACGDAKVAFRSVILDPLLTLSQPRAVTAAAGYDAISHAVESFVTTRRTVMSALFAREAWDLLEEHYERVLADPADVTARRAMLLGAHAAGIAIDQSMLGATHACANPLTAHHGTTHGVAIAIMLPHVVRWNAEHVEGRYAELMRMDPQSPCSAADVAERLAVRLSALARAGGLPATLREIGVARDDLRMLASDAATQWTGACNPRPFDAAGALELYERGY